MRDFDSIATVLSEREIDELQAAVDACRAACFGRPRRDPATPARDGAAGPEIPERGGRAG